jgi:hypothetical protein
MVTAPQVFDDAEPERTEPGRLADERASLESWLDHYRAGLLHKCAGLTAGQLAVRSCEPSPMSLTGLVRHMTEMERMYAHRLADRTLGTLYCTEQSPDGDFVDASEETAPGDLATFREHCTRSREIMAGHGLDDTFSRAASYNLRWVYLYLVKEYARHLGHADLIRERVDGATGE